MLKAILTCVGAKDYDGQCRWSAVLAFVAGIFIGPPVMAQSCNGVVDVWYANDESAGVSDAQVRDSLDFLYQVAEEFVFEAQSGALLSLSGWSNTVVDGTPTLDDLLKDADDSGLFDPNFDGSEADNSIVVDQDTQGVRERYRARLSSGGSTDLPALTAAIAAKINTDAALRDYAPQVAVIVTNAAGIDLADAAWNSALAGLELAGPNGVHIVLVLVDDAVSAYNADVDGAQVAIDNIIASYNSTLIVTDVYDNIANPSNGHVMSLVNAICDQSALSLAVTNSPGTFISILSTFTLDFQFGEAVTGFELNDIVATGATLSNFVTNSADSYSVLVSASGIDDISIAVAAGSALDSGGRDNVPLDLTIEFDSDADGIGNSTEGISLLPSRDTDDDDIADHLDLDSDNDGIPDAIESGSNSNQPVDTDFDGVPDYLDLDSDNDGIPDLVESGISYADITTVYDLDGNGRIDDGVVVGADGLANDLQSGVDYNGISYSVRDTDSDDIFDFRDRDSDGDGIFDLIQSGVNYGRIVVLDADKNGALDNASQQAGNLFGADGVLNEIQNSADNGVLDTFILDTDNDGIIDSLDSDADNDGLPDLLEAGDDIQNARDSDGDGIPNPSDRDSDGDRMPDRFEAGANPLTPIDSEGDGIPDYLDTDSDNDTVLDMFEQRNIDQLSGVDEVGDLGAAEGNGIDDNIDVAVTGGNDINSNFIDDAFEPSNFDGDAKPDYLDLDSDGDSILDIIEENNATPLSGVDSDFDGIDDVLDVDAVGGADLNNNGVADRFEPANTDRDDEPDFRDLDSDNDGMSDVTEFISLALAGNDSDMDGIDDVVDASVVGGTDDNANDILDIAEPVDSDGDGAPDYVDLDSDNDSLPDVQEAGLPDVNIDGQIDSPSDEASVTSPPDNDSDGIANYLDLESDDATNDAVAPFDIEGNSTPGLDLAVLDVSPVDGQIDSGFVDNDGDGILENGGFVNGPDFLNGFGTILDTDRDLVENAIDTDDDNDRIPDIDEGDGAIDTDGDGTPDSLDFDSDNDGIYDIYEAYATTAEANAIFAAFTDTNDDGMDDEVPSPFVLIDTDADGTPDFRDLDTDNDTLNDLFESASNLNDLLAADADQNGIVDSINPLNGTPNTNFTPIDSDGDGVDNYRDLDSDNDGFSDQLEAGDSNGNGISDTAENIGGEFKATTGGAGGVGLFAAIFSLLAIISRLFQACRINASKLTRLSVMLSVLLFIGMFGFTSLAQAKTDCGYDRPSEPEFQDCWYLGIGAGASSLEPEGSSNGWSIEDDGSTAWEFLLGKHFANRWFAELKYSSLGKAELQHANAAIDANFPDAHIAYESVSAAAGYYLFDENYPFNMYLKAGVASLEVHSEDNGDTVRLEDNNGIKAVLSFGATFRLSDSPWQARVFYDSFSENVAYAGMSIVRYIGGRDRSRIEADLALRSPAYRRNLLVTKGVELDSDNEMVDGAVGAADITRGSCFAERGIIERIYFSPNSDQLNEQDEALLLGYVYDFLRAKDVVIEVAGHYDSNEASGTMSLGLLRAKRVVNFLIDHGVSHKQLSVVDYANRKPIVTAVRGRPSELNARVEFTLLTSGQCD